MIFRTHCDLRLGDNLAALHFVRGLARKYPLDHFVHYARNQYLPQLVDVVCDLANVSLCDSRFRNPEQPSEDLWKGADNHWYAHPRRNEYAAYFLEFFAMVAKRMGLESPFANSEDLLFDYPTLEHKGDAGRFDFLVINSPPMSNQWQGYDEGEMTRLVLELHAKHRIITTHPVPGVPCTQNKGHSVTQIGKLSQSCDHILMVSTGPSWPTFNIWNKETVKLRIILIDSETIGLSANTVQCRTIREARAVLVEEALL